MSSKTYQVKLDIFEGPMDLLVHLIRKNEVDIYDIPISLITDQFLEYIEWLKTMDINVAGDFLLMAATLAKIKSSMMLPAHEIADDEEDDPRMEIARPLLEYMQIKSIARQLVERDLLGEATFLRSLSKEDIPIESDDRMIQVGLFELIDAFKKILENVTGERRIEFTADRTSVKDRITSIVDMLEAKGSVVFEELFPSSSNKKDIIVTFLAILEMVKLGLVQVAQHVQNGIIRLIYL